MGDDDAISNAAVGRLIAQDQGVVYAYDISIAALVVIVAGLFIYLFWKRE